ncbi:MAG: hypothetical protein KDN19_15660 [Verrucomicrobiae bacterium]|nr:hypothetical protein [Verrucomicrobiae bacterium]
MPDDSPVTQKNTDRTGDLKSTRAICFKGFLFLALGIFAAALILCLFPDGKLAVLLAIAIWGFCRFYYFAFYVIERWVDPEYRFSGLIDFFRYWMNRSK